jgi:hypothetical protein
MGESKDVKDAAERGVLLEHMAYICADNVSVKKPKKWALKNIHKGG